MIETRTDEASTGLSMFGRAAGVGALCLALIGCGAAKQPISIEPINSNQPVPTAPSPAEIFHAFEVHKIEARGFETAVANFIAGHPEQRITSIEGDGNAGYGRNSEFAVVTRRARAGEAQQRAEKINAVNSVEAALAYRTANPTREIDAMAGDGNGGYGRNRFYVVVSHEPRPPAAELE